MTAVQMSIERKIFPNAHPERIINTDKGSGQDSLVGETLAQVTLEGIIGLREHYFRSGVRKISALYVTSELAQTDAKRLWDKFRENSEIVYRFSTGESEAIKLITTETMLGTRNTIYPSGLIVAKLANVIQLTESHVLHYPNQS